MTDDLTPEDFERLLDDPDHPNRPQHPDFWKLSSVVLGMDALTEGDDGTEGLERALASAGVDIDSLVYMAKHRAARAIQHGHTEGVALLDVVMSAWIDAFIAGNRYGFDRYGDLRDHGSI